MSAPRIFVKASLVLFATTFLLCASAGAQQPSKSNAASAAKSSSTAQTNQADLIAEGEQRFHANCGRCHQAPHKFPPRMILTIERHMRVRATVTDEDMRAIVAFLTQ